jgi:hypothetical protein
MIGVAGFTLAFLGSLAGRLPLLARGALVGAGALLALVALWADFAL